MRIQFENKEIIELIKTAKEAGKKIMEIYQESYKSYTKENNSIVTDADIASNKTILSRLEKYDYSVLSEEKKDNLSRLEEDRIWVVDPLDGTRDFIERTGEFSVMIALAEKGVPILGVVCAPSRKEIYFAEKGKGSFFAFSNKITEDFEDKAIDDNDTDSITQLQVSEVSELSKSRFVFSRSHMSEEEREFIRKHQIADMDFVGSIGIKLGLIARKRNDGYITFTTKTCEWDTCAPEIILEEAGGKVTDLKGNNLTYNNEEVKNLNGIVASNGFIHNQIIESI